MGVSYFISYDLKGASGLASREGAALAINDSQKLNFYMDLYGSKNVFETTQAEGQNSQYFFINPSTSFPSYKEYQSKSTQASLVVEGRLPLYEEKYEKDKVQFYVPITTSGLTSKGASPLSKRIVRIMGRIRGCAPSSDKQDCGEAAFDQEFQSLMKEIY